MFVQQFVNVEEPLHRAVERFEQDVAPHLSAIVDRAWRTENGAAVRTDHRPVPVQLGHPRTRADSVVYAMSWPSDPGVGLPEIDADLELSELTPGRTHLQFTGQSRFPALERWSEDELRAQRRCLSGIAAVLAEVARAISGAPAESSAADSS